MKNSESVAKLATTFGNFDIITVTMSIASRASLILITTGYNYSPDVAPKMLINKKIFCARVEGEYLWKSGIYA